MASLKFKVGPQERKKIEDAGQRVTVLSRTATLPANASRNHVVTTCKGFADQFLPDLDRMFQGHSGKVELSL